jgi:hypothetical protein
MASALMMPAFSTAISSGEVPRKRWWSTSIGVMTETGASTTLVASQDPPIPTSTTATSTGRSAKAAYATATSTSKYVIAGPPRVIDCASTISTKGMTSSYAARKRSASIGRPPTAMRSSIECRCGLVNRPVFSPSSRSTASMIRTVLVLPFVPVTWMTGKERCGSPRSSITARMRSREGWRSCSGARERIDSSTCRIRVRTSSRRAASRWLASGAGLTAPLSTPVGDGIGDVGGVGMLLDRSPGPLTTGRGPPRTAPSPTG